MSSPAGTPWRRGAEGDLELALLLLKVSRPPDTVKILASPLTIAGLALVARKTLDIVAQNKAIVVTETEIACMQIWINRWPNLRILNHVLKGLSNPCCVPVVK